MIDKFLYSFFGWIDSMTQKVEDVFTFDVGEKNKKRKKTKKCKYCQIDFEMKLKREDKWEDQVKEQEEKRWEAVLAEYEDEMKQMKEADGPFDKTVAHAIGNHEQGLNKI